MAILKNSSNLEVKISPKLKELLKHEQEQLIKNKNVIIEKDFQAPFMIRKCPRCSLEMVPEGEYFRCPHCKLIKIPKNLIPKIDKCYEMKDFLKDKIMRYREILNLESDPRNKKIFSDCIKKLQGELEQLG